jgi:hypothetical protein
MLACTLVFLGPVAYSQVGAPGPAATTEPSSVVILSMGPPALPTTSRPGTGADASGPADPAALTEAEQISRELKQTDRLIALHRTKVLRSGNTKAQDLLANAVKSEREARQSFLDGHYARAGRLTREARAAAREAAVLVGPPQDDPAYVRHVLDRAGEALRMAEDVLEQGAQPIHWKRYQELRGQLEEGRRQLGDSSPRQAYALATQVRDGVLDLLRQCQDLPVPKETAERAVRRAERSIEISGRELGSKPNVRAARLSKDAQAQMSKAKAALSRGSYRSAVIYSKLVERSLEEAITAQRDGPQAVAPARAIPTG